MTQAQGTSCCRTCYGWMCTAANVSICCERADLRRASSSSPGLTITKAAPGGARARRATGRSRRSTSRQRPIEVRKDASRRCEQRRARRPPPTPRARALVRRPTPSTRRTKLVIPDRPARRRRRGGQRLEHYNPRRRRRKIRNLEAYAPRVVVPLDALPEVSGSSQRLHLGRVRPS